MDKVTLASLACVLLFVQCNGLKWKDCGSKKGKVKNVVVSGCDKTDVCILTKGSTAKFAVEFSPSEDVTKATAAVHGIIGGIPIPFPIGNPDGCTDSGLTCPVKSGSDVTYSTSLAVKSEYPSLKLVVEWELKDQSGDDIFCVELPAQIKAPSKDNNTKPRDNSTKGNSKLYFKPHA